MSWLSRLPIDRFLLAIIAAAALASVFPATGIAVDVVEWATTVAIAFAGVLLALPLGLLFLPGFLGTTVVPLALHVLGAWQP